MKFKIEKDERHSNLQVSFTHDTAKKPIVLDLDRAKAQLLISLLTTALHSDSFTFSMEL